MGLSKLGDKPHLWGHAVGDAEGQVLQDALHAVVVLLPGGAQVLLQSPGHGGEDGLGGLPGVHHLPWGFLLLLSLETLDVDEGLLHCNHQPAGDETQQSGPWCRAGEQSHIECGMTPPSLPPAHPRLQSLADTPDGWERREGERKAKAKIIRGMGAPG